MNRVLLLLTVLTVALAACGDGEASRAPSGVSTATPAPATTTAAATPTVEVTSTAALPPAPVQGEPTEVEEHLATLAGESPTRIAGGVELLLDQCTDERVALGVYAEQTWRILNEQRGLSVPVTAIVGRVIAALPVDGRQVGCESLFASIVTELSRH